MTRGRWSGLPDPPRPSHIRDTSDDKATRCGLTPPDDLPYTLARFVQAHVDGHGMTVCPACAEAGWPA